MMHDPMNGREARHPHGRHSMIPFGDGPECMPRSGFRHDREPFDAMPRDFDSPDAGFHCMPRSHSGPGGSGGPGGFGPGGVPPRRPNPDFLKRCIEDSDLLALIDMAGRMTQRLPQGGPAKRQTLVLSILAGRDALSQRELQQMLGIQPGSVSELLSKLEGKGYLTREKAEDRRGNLLRITDAGRTAMPTADNDPEDDPFDVLTPEQQDQLSSMLRTLLNRWVDAMAAAGPRERRAPLPHHERPVEL